jgi:malate dehydrogenase (oxaloacetate-decarboxylating)
VHRNGTLSNPTSRSEATPQDLVDWTAGRAVIGTGSPFPPVKCGGASQPVDQTNNAYIFPGVGLGVLAINARRVTDSMFMAAAKALALSLRQQSGGRPVAAG